MCLMFMDPPSDLYALSSGEVHGLELSIACKIRYIDGIVEI